MSGGMSNRLISGSFEGIDNVLNDGASLSNTKEADSGNVRSEKGMG